MSGSFSERAAGGQGGMIVEPPISMEKASEIVGQDISDDAWQRIRAAFHEYGHRQLALSASKLSLSKGDPQSWHMRKDATSKAINAAMAKLVSARSKHGNFLEEASDLFAMQTLGRPFAPDFRARRLLDEAYALMLRAVTVIDRAEPKENKTQTAAHARDLLVREIRNALKSDGVETRLSSGWGLADIDRTIFLKDLTPFEKLIVEFRIGDDVPSSDKLRSPAAFSAWLRGALAVGEKQG